MARRVLLLHVLFLLLCSCESAVTPSRSPRTLTVDPYGDTGYRTTQDALDAAVDGDTIELVNGRHSGPGNRDLELGDKSLTIRSQRGDARLCIIDADGFHLSPPEPHFNFRIRLLQPAIGQRPRIAFENLRIEDGFKSVVCDSGTAPVFRNCTFEYSYRAVTSTAASPTFINCSFDNNRNALVCYGSKVVVAGGRVWQNYGFTEGAGIFARGSHVTISDCQFIRNGTYDGGAAIRSLADSQGNRSRLDVMNSRFHHQAYNDVVWLEQTDFLFQGCVFSDNDGPAFIYDDSYGKFVESVLYGAAIYVDSGSSASIETCIVVFNGTSPGVHCGHDGTATVQASCSDFYGNADECIVAQIGVNGNTSVDPMFCFFDEGDFRLDPDSPLTANPSCPIPGGWQVGCETSSASDHQSTMLR